VVGPPETNPATLVPHYRDEPTLAVKRRPAPERPQTSDAAERVAAREGRTVSELAREALQKYLAS
jgi:hypothetical protein